MTTPEAYGLPPATQDVIHIGTQMIRAMFTVAGDIAAGAWAVWTAAPFALQTGIEAAVYTVPPALLDTRPATPGPMDQEFFRLLDGLGR